MYIVSYNVFTPMNIPEEDSKKIFAQFLHTGYFSVPFEATSRVIEIGFNQVWLIVIIITIVPNIFTTFGCTGYDKSHLSEVVQDLKSVPLVVLGMT